MNDFLGTILIIFIWIVVGFFLCINPAIDIGFKKGQIAAISGDIQYELVLQKTGETDWEKIDK
jgi:hypothetical protein